MTDSKLAVVTGAFGFSGRHITRLLFDQGYRVRTLTAHPNRPNPFTEHTEAFPYNFDNSTALAECLRGADTFFNTYWVRFNYADKTFAQAVENTRALLTAAKAAGLRRFVHIGITNPSLDSPYPYFRGKAEIEHAVKHCGLSYTILRPAVLFGHGSILINNIAWLLRHSPLFPIAGDGRYKLQPIFVGDLARLAVEHAQNPESTTIDAVGPETFTFLDLVQFMKEQLKGRARIIHLPPGLVLAAAHLVGLIVKDVLLTRDEIHGLMDNLLVTDSPPSGQTRFTHWFAQNKNEIGKTYLSELQQHYR